jgi:energy-coupling factor transporter transmembrane protein EcfT
MQRTRINTALSSSFSKATAFFANPWRKLSLTFIFLLFGFFIASAIASLTGQIAYWDVTAALFLLVFTEFVSIVVYRRDNKRDKLLGLDVLNAFKFGLVYGLYLEAFKLNS